jgi:hypothetical protein
MSEFSRELAKQDALRSAVTAGNVGQQALAAHLLETSGDPAGSRIEDYFSPEEAAICHEFLDEAGARGWPRIEQFELRTRKGFDWPVWRSTQHAVHPLSRRILLEPVWSGVGYGIGSLNISANGPKVILCSDRTLRNERTPLLYSKSYGMGYGRLPDARHIPKDPKIMSSTYRNIAGVLANYL